MVDVLAPPEVPSVTHARPPISDEAQTSIASYLSAGDAAGNVAGIAWKVLIVPLVALLIAWAMGMLPATTRL